MATQNQKGQWIIQKNMSVKEKNIEIIMEYRQHKREATIILPIYNRDRTISRPDRLQIK